MRWPSSSIHAVSGASGGWTSYWPRQAGSPRRCSPKNSAVPVVPPSSVTVSVRAAAGTGGPKRVILRPAGLKSHLHGRRTVGQGDVPDGELPPRLVDDLPGRHHAQQADAW